MLRDVRFLLLADEPASVRSLLDRNSLRLWRVGIAAAFPCRLVRSRPLPACILARGLSVTTLLLRWLDCPPPLVLPESPSVLRTVGRLSKANASVVVRSLLGRSAPVLSC